MSEYDKRWIEVLEILIKYKFTNEETSEKVADKICNIFNYKYEREERRGKQ